MTDFNIGVLVTLILNVIYTPTVSGLTSLWILMAALLGFYYSDKLSETIRPLYALHPTFPMVLRSTSDILKNTINPNRSPKIQDRTFWSTPKQTN